MAEKTVPTALNAMLSHFKKCKVLRIEKKSNEEINIWVEHLVIAFKSESIYVMCLVDVPIELAQTCFKADLSQMEIGEKLTIEEKVPSTWN